MFQIPNDDNKSWRKKQFISMFQDAPYIDGATDYCLLMPFADDNQLDVNECLWLAYLYGLSYSCTTAIRLFREFSDPTAISPGELKRFWDSEKSTLWFNPDKKYLKNNNQVIPAIKSLYKILRQHENFEAYILSVMQESQEFESMYKEIQKNWQYFGSHGAYLFFDALYGLIPEMYYNPKELDWKHAGKTVSEGMAHFLYLDDSIGTGEYPINSFNKAVQKIQEKTGEPLVHIESTLCAYRKLFKGTRYVGYYADRMLEEAHATEKFVPTVWRFRERTIPKHLRGEDGGWTGIRKELCKKFLETGEL